MVLVVILGRTGRTEFNFPATIARPGRQRRAQPPPRALDGDRRRRPRPGRLLRRRRGADVRLHPAPLPGPLRMGPPGRVVLVSAVLVALGELALPTEGFAGLLGRVRALGALPARPARQRLLHRRGAPLAGAAAPPRASCSSACARRAAARPRSTARSPRPTRPCGWTKTPAADDLSIRRCIERRPRPASRHGSLAALREERLAGVGPVDAGRLAGDDGGGEGAQRRRTRR